MIKRTLIIFISLFLVFSNLFAEKPKSKFAAALLSLAVPGTGELYASNKTSGMLSLTSEVFIWLGYFASKKQAEWAKNDFQQYARAYSNNSNANPDEDYYDLIQNYQSSDEYNNNVLIYARQGLYSGWTEATYNEFIDTNLQTGSRSWNWDSDEHFYEYATIRVDRNEYNIIAKFTVGALVINRFVSALKAVINTNNFNKNLEKRNKISFLYDIDPFNAQASIYLQTRF